jgi:hypothetical protein
MSRYTKAIGAFLTGALAWLTIVVESDSESITSTEWLALAGLVVTTVVVYLLPNSEPAGG